MACERRRVLFTGRVQGVGFRFTSQSLARGFPVAGFVRNLPDGRVELIAEGHPRDLDAYLASIHRQMGSLIWDSVTESEAPGPQPLTGFSIRH